MVDEVKDDWAKTLSEVQAREKVIKSLWLDKTKDIYDTYEGGKADSTPFNILYSNTEVLVPNLYSSTPRPVVRKRFGDMRADEASKAAERMSEYCMDTNLSGYPDFTSAVSAAVLDSALPGQGQCRLRVVDGIACIDFVQHDEFIWGYAKRWEDVPWVAYIAHLTYEDVAKKFKLTPEQKAKLQKPTSDDQQTKDQGPPTICVYEVWNKEAREVYFLCDSIEDKLLQRTPDPLQLTGFFPSGCPLRLLSTPVSTMPRPLYNLYRRQAAELNEVTQRITRITKAVRVRGVYDGTIPEMANIFGDSDTENALLPSSSPGNMLREGGLDKHIWLVPTEKLVQTLQVLHQVRDQIKSTIYEILGIGDILRGVSSASETASAQKIKDKWGSLRIKKSREAVSIFVRTQLRMLVEASAKHTPEEVWAKVTGLPFIPALQAAAMPPAMPGMPPPPPSWQQVLQILQNDLTRSYVIDIETNSTVDADATEDKAEVAEFMNALGQSMQGLESLASIGAEGFEAAKALLVEICKRYRMGNELQGILTKLQAPPKGPTEEQQKKQEELDQREKTAQQAEESAKATGEGLKAQFDQHKQQLDQAGEQVAGQKSQLEELMLKLEKKQNDLDAQQAALDVQMREIELAKQSVELAKEKATVEVSKLVNEESTAAAERDLGHQANVNQFEAQKAKDTADAAEKTLGQTDAIKQLLAGIAEQTKAVQSLIDTHARPVIISKTGPGKYERKLG